MMESAKRLKWYLYDTGTRAAEALAKERLVELDQEATEKKAGSRFAAGEEGYDTIFGIRFIWVPSGAFIRGGHLAIGRSEGMTHPHVVGVSGFWMSQIPVTWALWCDVMGRQNSEWGLADGVVIQALNEGGDADVPVCGISWHDAMAFCERYRCITNIPVALPREAEWEYTCRAKDTLGPCFGYEGIKSVSVPILEQPWVEGRLPVKATEANAFGIYDMMGNIFEWQEDSRPGDEIDWYTYLGFNSAYVLNPRCDFSGRGNVLKGGPIGKDMRVGNWHYTVRFPEYRSRQTGFRIVVRGHENPVNDMYLLKESLRRPEWKNGFYF